MALNAAGLQAFADLGNEAVVWGAIGSGSASGNENSAARVQLTMSVSGGVITVTNVPMAFTGTPAAAATHLLLFSASSAGTFYGFDALSGDAAYNAAGQFEISSCTFTYTGT
jgi:hypothetical protein